MRSGFTAAKVLGVTSAKISTTMVRIAVEMAGPLTSPKKWMAMMVAMEAARLLTKLLPIRMTPISRSGRASRRITRLALRCPLLAWWLNR